MTPETPAPSRIGFGAGVLWFHRETGEKSATPDRG